MTDYAIVAAAHDRAAVGRGILATLAIAAIGAGLLIFQPGHDHRLVISGDAHGQCYVSASVNGSLVEHLLLDSGASGHLTFGRNQAAQLGYDPAKLSFSHPYGSANGVGHYASVRVREFRLDSFVLRDVPAEITDASQSKPLIGIEILHRLNLQLKGGNCEISWS